MRFQLLHRGWRGYLIAEFALVWVANIYMSVFNHLRLEIKHENLTIEQVKVNSAEPSLKHRPALQRR